MFNTQFTEDQAIEMLETIGRGELPDILRRLRSVAESAHAITASVVTGQVGTARGRYALDHAITDARDVMFQIDIEVQATQALLRSARSYRRGVQLTHGRLNDRGL